MVVADRVTERDDLQLARHAPDCKGERHDGRFVEKPAMNFTRNYAAAELRQHLRNQLDPARFVVGMAGRGW